ncbi:MAG: ABC transporter permease [Thermoleophilaceae bacterium]
MIRDSVRIAVRAILANRLRSALTMLGLIIGVSSVIILLAVGRGAQGAIAGELEDLGTNVLTVLRRGEVGPNQTGTQSRDVELSSRTSRPFRTAARRAASSARCRC